MGKKKIDLEALKREDPKENNWEIPENEEVRMKNEEKKDVTEKPQKPESDTYCGPNYKPVEAPVELKEVFREITDGTVEAEEMKRSMYYAWEKVDPEIRTGNPLWKFSRKDNKFVFVFRNGQKVRVEL